ncbi:transcription termination factor Rho [Ornithinimicrobium humiphilum]|uniref:Transcription termination factor Rho n=1 Tax=Ornithinimicrobium humiphilum TaxID=125288 RepID=A0A543KLK9_9MICO|nr:transcription termination factor Rho [Ornithinimicrobium humiphilum]TQM95958.1 transcription termination factor Rho [Ornithinimicrobium humiphilum]
MTEITESAATKTGSLSTLRLAELQQLASSMGIAVNAKMRKADLVSAIRERRGGGAAAPAAAPRTAPARTSERAGTDAAPAEAPETKTAPAAEPARAETPAPGADPASGLEAALDRAQAEREGRTRRTRRAGSHAGAPRSAEGREQAAAPQAETAAQAEVRERAERAPQQERGERAPQQDRGERQGRQDRQDRGEQGQQDRAERQDRRAEQDARQQERTQGGQQHGDQQGDDEDGERGGRRRRNRQRSRDRKRGRGSDAPNGTSGGSQRDDDEGYSDEDVLVPVGGVLDLLDSYAFIRTTGYLPGPTDVYVPMSIVRKHGLRKGDAVTGVIKAPEDDGHNQHTVSATGNKRDRGKFSALVRLDSVNGQPPEAARNRPEFSRLTPLYPQERLRLETDQKNLTTRVIDLVAPIGKGQRGLIVSPPKAGKTMIMQAIANAITTNNPEVHLMIVLVDERPEEVTDFQRSVKGEVIASTFDRPATDHTIVAELAIERAKRLVELGQDVVVLLDGITRLGRAYNLSAPASGRILSGGVDSSALYPPKKFFGAARNIENGGSLTILATALVETGSKMDEVIFEEFKGTGNMELRLSRQLADRRTFPAVDVNASGTRREEILMSGEELKIMWKLRRVLSALDQQQGIELLIDRLKKTRHNYEFLTQVQQTASARLDDED